MRQPLFNFHKLYLKIKNLIIFYLILRLLHLLLIL
jgi:hypothetical protein